MATTFWDRCIDLGDANGTHLWKCPKRHPDGAREIGTLLEGAEVVESRGCYWIVCRSRFAETLNHISDTFIEEGMGTPVAKQGKPK